MTQPRGLREAIERIPTAKGRATARAEAARTAVLAAKPKGTWTAERDGNVVIFDRDPEFIRDRDGVIVGIDATIRMFRNGSEVKCDPHRVFINPPVQVPDGGFREVDGQRVPTYREDPEAAYLEMLWESLRIAPNPKGWRTRGTVTTVYSSTNDGYISSSNATYATARTGGGTRNVATATTLIVGQILTGGPTYICWESFIDFDTSSIPDNDTITAVVLSLDGQADGSTTDFTAQARIYDWGGTVTTGDWVSGASLPTPIVATWASSGYVSGYNDFTDTGNFIANLNLTGTTSLMITSSRHAGNNTPTGNESVTFESADASGTTSDPKLTITHEAPNTAPEITDGPTASYTGGVTGVFENNSPATVTFTATDAEQTGANALSWQIRTASGGGGTLVASGTCTSGVEEEAEIAYDASGLVDGAQTLYLLVSDGSLTDEESFSATRLVAHTSELSIVAGIGGFAQADLSVVAGVGGWASAELGITVEIPPSPLRIAYALTGRYGPVVSRVRYERRTVANQFLEDVTHAILGCHIEGNINRTVFRTATFEIDPGEATIDPLRDHIAVFTDLLVDGNYTLPLQWGLFALTLPQKTFSPLGTGSVREVWAVEANDNTIHLLEDGPSETYVIPAGTNYVTAITTILDALGLPHALPSTTATTPRELSWPVGAATNWATIVNDLLAGINHYTIKPDQGGTFRARESQDLANRTPDVTYTGDDFVLIPIVEEVETTRFANKIFATSGELVAVVTNDDPASPTSTVSLGRTIPRWITVDAAADQTALEAAAAAYLREGSYLYRRANLITQPDPRRGFNEVVELDVPGLYDGERWAIQSWSVDLRPVPVPQMQFTVSKVDAVAVVTA